MTLAEHIDKLLSLYAPNATWTQSGSVVRIAGAGPEVVRLVAGRLKAKGWGVAVEGAK